MHYTVLFNIVNLDKNRFENITTTSENVYLTARIHK